MEPADIIARSNAAYDQARAIGATPHERVLWGDPARQYFRFDELLRLAGAIDAANLEVLDVGCGNGELLQYLDGKGFRGKYRGIDIHAGQIAEARSRFPAGDFHVGDIFSNIAAADIVMMSGVFNVDCGQDMDFIERFVGRCVTLARERFVFNAITSYVSRRDRGTFYLAPEAAIGIAAKLSPRFELRHGFLPFNYTLCIHTAAADGTAGDGPAVA